MTLCLVMPSFGQPYTDDAINSQWQFWLEGDNSRHIVDLPHDAQQTLPRDSTVKGGYATGYAAAGVYHYQKCITVTPEMMHRHLTLHFEGVYRNAKVLVNGQIAGSHNYGYTGFDIALDGFVKQGENVIEVVADNSAQPNSRWYSGGGIYRPIHLLMQERDIRLTDVQIMTLCIAPATIRVKADHVGGIVRTTILQGKKIVAKVMGDDVNTVIGNAQLWSADSPTLYQARVELLSKGKVVETRTIDFGIRQVSWNPRQGLLVNGVPTLLRGGCIHHDNGLLGACEYDDAAFRRIQILKSYGYNAIRSAHNPCSEAVLRACDRLGMYIMDETWDMWYDTKSEADYSLLWKDHWQKDVEALIRKDYNHPSVILYCIGNELSEIHDSLGLETEREVVDMVHRLDNTRPVTCGLNLMIMSMAKKGARVFGEGNGMNGKLAKRKMTSEKYNMLTSMAGGRMMSAVTEPGIDEVATPACDLLDIAGYNYGSRRYKKDFELHPERLLVGTETMPYDIGKIWPLVEEHPQLIGDFMWTAWDYLGECGIGAWFQAEEAGSAFNKPYPWLAAGVGALDLLGYPTGEALWAKAVWAKDGKPLIGVWPVGKGDWMKAIWRGTPAIPNWSWLGCEGQKTTVEVYCSAPTVELYLNGQLLGSQTTSQCRALFDDIAWQPGTLRAVSIAEDGTRHESELSSATGNPRIRIQTEREQYCLGQLIYADINIEGDNGEIIGNADQMLSVDVQGARLLAFGSAKLATEERFSSGRYPSQWGRAQAILLATQPGMVTLTVKGEHIKDNCTAIIKIK